MGYGFQVGEYDPSRFLILDPALLIYCGYIGGAANDIGNGIAVDSSGNAYVTGQTFSTEASFPVTVGPDLISNGAGDAFVAKVSASGITLLYCGYIGGAVADAGNDIDLDSLNCAYIVGTTNSSKAQNFPGTIPGNDLSGADDAFVAKVKSDGTGLAYCRYIGSAGEDYGSGISIGIVESAYITGWTYSDQTSFPKTTGPDYQGGGDAFVGNLGPTGALAYCRYIGGTNLDVGCDIQVDNLDYAYITGYTASTESNNFPVTVGPDLTYNGGALDAFVPSVKSDGTGLVFCTYMGGSGYEIGHGIASGLGVFMSRVIPPQQKPASR